MHHKMPSVKCHPVTKGRWKDLEHLFAKRGACGGCWCMAWRLKTADWVAGKGSTNRNRMKNIVNRGDVPGILAYIGKIPIGWCSVAPRSDFVFLERSRVLARVDNRSVWSVSCFFVRKDFRRMGLSIKLLRGAIEYVRSRGGTIVEGYPVEPYVDRMPDVFAWTGTVQAYRKAGFKEVMRRSKSRRIMRFHILPISEQA